MVLCISDGVMREHSTQQETFSSFTVTANAFSKAVENTLAIFARRSRSASFC